MLNSDGLEQKVGGKAVDKAGNESVATPIKVSIDSVKPVITMGAVKASYTAR